MSADYDTVADFQMAKVTMSLVSSMVNLNRSVEFSNYRRKHSFGERV